MVFEKEFLNMFFSNIFLCKNLTPIVSHPTRAEDHDLNKINCRLYVTIVTSPVLLERSEKLRLCKKKKINRSNWKLSFFINY